MNVICNPKVASCAFLLVFMLSACARQVPGPVYVDIMPSGTSKIGEGEYDNVSLKRIIKEKINNEGANIPFYFIADKETPFSKVKAVMIAVANGGGYNFNLQILGGNKAEYCCHNRGTSDGLKKITKLNIEVRNDELFVNGKKMSMEEFKKLISTKPSDINGYSGLLLCSDDSKLAGVYDVIEAANHAKTIGLKIAIFPEE